MPYMVNNELLNVASFMASYLGRFTRASSGDISVGGMITLISDNLGLEFNIELGPIIKGKFKVDMESLIYQAMIHWEGNTYSVMMNNINILNLPNPRKLRVDIDRN